MAAQSSAGLLRERFGVGALRTSAAAIEVAISRFHAMYKTVSRDDRGGAGIAPHLITYLSALEARGDCTLIVEYGPPGADGVTPVVNLRAFICTAEQAAFLRAFPSCKDVWTVDATFSPGNNPLSLMGIVGHVPETGGDAVPLAFLISLSAPHQAEGARTQLFEWFFDLAETKGLTLPRLVLADKCTATAKAWALVAHKRLDAAADARAALVATLQAGAAGATAAEEGAAQLLVDSFRDASAVAAAAASAAAAKAALAHDADAALEATDTASIALDDNFFRSCVAGVPAEPPALPAPVALLFKRELLESHGAAARGLCAVLLKDLDAAEEARVATKDQSAAAFCAAHTVLAVHAAFWARDGAAGAYLVRFCLPSYGLCYYHAGVRTQARTFPPRALLCGPNPAHPPIPNQRRPSRRTRR
jgi:hypothetical protein